MRLDKGWQQRRQSSEYFPSSGGMLVEGFPRTMTRCAAFGATATKGGARPNRVPLRRTRKQRKES